MNQRVFLGGRPTLLDVAKSAVETFVKVSCLLLSDFFLIIEVPRVRFLHTYKYLHVQFYDMQYMHTSTITVASALTNFHIR